MSQIQFPLTSKLGLQLRSSITIEIFNSAGTQLTILAILCPLEQETKVWGGSLGYRKDSSLSIPSIQEEKSSFRSRELKAPVMTLSDKKGLSNRKKEIMM
jgi:hypothetical protein